MTLSYLSLGLLIYGCAMFGFVVGFTVKFWLDEGRRRP